MKYLKSEIKRLETANKYLLKMEKAKKDSDKDYFFEGFRLMLSMGENIDNFHDVLNEYNVALKAKEEETSKLYDEIKIIKKLKI